MATKFLSSIHGYITLLPTVQHFRVTVFSYFIQLADLKDTVGK